MKASPPVPSAATPTTDLTQLDRYLFRQAGVPFVLILVCTTAVVWLTQILQRVDLMVEDGGSLAAFLQVTVLLLPSLLGVIAPFAVLGAVLYALNTLASDSELPVLGAAGASRLRLARPLAALGVLGGLLVLAINLDAMPRSQRQIKQTAIEVRSDIARSLIRSGVFTEVLDGVTIYADEVRPGDQYVGLLIHDGRDAAKSRTFTAESGLFRMTAAGPRLLLARGTVQERDASTDSVAIYQFLETAVDLASFAETPDQRFYEASERFVGELLDPYTLGMRPPENEARGFVAEGHARLSGPIYPLAFALIAAAVFLNAPAARRGYGRRVVIGLAVAVAVRTAGFLAQGAATEAPSLNVLQYLVPLGAVFAAGAVVAGGFWRVRTRRGTDVFSDLEATA